MAALVHFKTRYTTLDAMLEIGTTTATVEYCNSDVILILMVA